METIISKFVFGKFICFLYTVWDKNNSFVITITDGTYVWENKITTEYIEKNLLPSGMEIVRYIQLVKMALREQDIEKKAFQYSLGKKGENLKLTWKIKEMGEDNLEFWLEGFIVLIKQETARQMILEIISNMITQQCELKNANLKLKESNEDLSKQIEESVNLTKYLVNEKKLFETQLYTKFAMVLNQKKAKIRSLKQKLVNINSPKSSKLIIKTEKQIIPKNETKKSSLKLTPKKKNTTKKISPEKSKSPNLLEYNSVSPVQQIRKRYRPDIKDDNKSSKKQKEKVESPVTEDERSPYKGRQLNNTKKESTKEKEEEEEIEKSSDSENDDDEKENTTPVSNQKKKKIFHPNSRKVVSPKKNSKYVEVSNNNKTDNNKKSDNNNNKKKKVYYNVGDKDADSLIGEIIENF